MASAKKRFRHTRNEAFVCAHCGARVPSLASGSTRNHCPYCLWSKHVDQVPGDRASGCGGMMACIDVQQNPRRKWMLVHRCVRCGTVRRNKAALDDAVQPDRFEVLLRIARKAVERRRKQ